MGVAALVGVSLPKIGNPLVTQHKLGKLDPKPVKLSLVDYVKQGVPTPPNEFGHYAWVPKWGMYGNDKYGDCVWAGAAHEHMLWCAESKTPLTFTDANVLQAYTDVTQFNPNDPNSDQGTIVADALKYRASHGLADANGNAHKLGGYMALQPGNLKELAVGTWMFSAVGMGIQFPSFAHDQFNHGAPWDLSQSNTGIEGGHYIPIVGFHNSMYVCVTWGRLQYMTINFIKEYCDEAYALLSPEFLTNGKSPEGFDINALSQDLRDITAA